MIHRGDAMEYILMLCVGDEVKPLKEATPEEKKALEEKMKREFQKHLGLRYIGKAEKSTK